MAGMNAYIDKKSHKLLAVAYGVEWPKGFDESTVAVVALKADSVAALASHPPAGVSSFQVDPDTLKVSHVMTDGKVAASGLSIAS